MGRRRRLETALILVLIYSSMVHLFAFSTTIGSRDPNLPTSTIEDTSKHQESEHRRYDIEGRHGYTNVIPIDIAITRGGARGGRHGGGGNGAAGIGDQNYMKYIAAGVSISIAYLCGLI